MSIIDRLPRRTQMAAAAQPTDRPSNQMNGNRETDDLRPNFPMRPRSFVRSAGWQKDQWGEAAGEGGEQGGESAQGERGRARRTG